MSGVSGWARTRILRVLVGVGGVQGGRDTVRVHFLGKGLRVCLPPLLSRPPPSPSPTVCDFRNTLRVRRSTFVKYIVHTNREGPLSPPSSPLLSDPVTVHAPGLYPLWSHIGLSYPSPDGSWKELLDWTRPEDPRKLRGPETTDSSLYGGCGE